MMSVINVGTGKLKGYSINLAEKQRAVRVGAGKGPRDN